MDPDPQHCFVLDVTLLRSMHNAHAQNESLPLYPATGFVDFLGRIFSSQSFGWSYQAGSKTPRGENCHGTLRLMIHHNTSGTFDSLHHDNSQFFDKFFLCKANNFPFGFRLNFSPIEEKLAFPCSTFLVPMQLCNPFYKELVLL